MLPISGGLLTLLCSALSQVRHWVRSHQRDRRRTEIKPKAQQSKFASVSEV